MPYQVDLHHNRVCQCLSIYLYLSISIYIYLYLSISIYIYLYLSTYLSIYLSIYLSTYLSIYLHVGHDAPEGSPLEPGSAPVCEVKVSTSLPRADECAPRPLWRTPSRAFAWLMRTGNDWTLLKSTNWKSRWVKVFAEAVGKQVFSSLIER